MKKALLTLLVSTGLFLGLAASASAWIQVGPCQLHAYNPVFPSGTTNVEGSGQVTSCSSEVVKPSEIEVCTQYLNGGAWSTIQTTCNTVQFGAAEGYSGPVVNAHATYAACGTWYRTWDWTHLVLLMGEQYTSPGYVGNAGYRC